VRSICPVFLFLFCHSIQAAISQEPLGPVAPVAEELVDRIDAYYAVSESAAPFDVVWESKIADTFSGVLESERTEICRLQVNARKERLTFARSLSGLQQKADGVDRNLETYGLLVDGSKVFRFTNREERWTEITRFVGRKTFSELSGSQIATPVGIGIFSFNELHLFETRRRELVDAAIRKGSSTKVSRSGDTLRFVLNAKLRSGNSVSTRRMSFRLPEGLPIRSSYSKAMNGGKSVRYWEQETSFAIVGSSYLPSAVHFESLLIRSSPEGKAVYEPGKSVIDAEFRWISVNAEELEPTKKGAIPNELSILKWLDGDQSEK